MVLNKLERAAYDALKEQSIEVCEGRDSRLMISLLEVVQSIPEIRNSRVALRVIFSLRVKGLIKPLAESKLACRMIPLPLSTKVDFEIPRLYEITDMKMEEVKEMTERKESIDRRKKEAGMILEWVQGREYFSLEEIETRMPLHQLIRLLKRIGCVRECYGEEKTERWHFSSEKALMPAARTPESIQIVEQVLNSCRHQSLSVKELVDLSNVNWSVDIMRVFIMERGWVKDPSQRFKWRFRENLGSEAKEILSGQSIGNESSTVEDKLFELKRRATVARVRADDLRLQVSAYEEEAERYEEMATDLLNDYKIFKSRLSEVDSILN